MLRALWFLVQIAVVVLAAIWLLERPGEVELSAFDYSLTIQTGLFLILFIVAAMLFSLLARALLAIVSLPSWLGGWSKKRRRARAMKQLTQGYALLAAGQADKALKFSRKIQDALPEMRALALLLEAQASRLLGRDAEAASAYQQLMQDKDAAFLGLKGLLGQSVAHGRTEQALEYAHKAAKMHPKAGWVIKTLYDLQIAARDFETAKQTLKKAVKLKAVSKEQAASDEMAMLMYQAEKLEEAGRSDEAVKLIERAVKLDPSFTPPVVALAAIFIERGKTRKAQSLVETAWKTNPHPMLLPLWDRLAPANTSRDMMRRIRWYEALVDLNAQSDLAHIAAAREAMEHNLTGEARGHLTRAQAIRDSAAARNMELALARKDGKGETVLRQLEERLQSAPPSPVWHCKKTGMVYENWAPLARPHGSFNTIEWGLAGAPAANTLLDKGDVLDDPLMLGAF